MKKIFILSIIIILLFSGCNNKSAENKKTEKTQTQTTRITKKSNLKNKIPVLFDSKVYIAENYLDFEKSKGKPIKKDYFEVAAQRNYVYKERIFGIESKTNYIFGADILQQVTYKIPLKNQKQNLISKIKKKAIEVYNLSEKDFKKESETKYTFRKFIVDQSGIDSFIELAKNNLTVTIYALNASGTYYDTTTQTTANKIEKTVKTLRKTEETETTSMKKLTKEMIEQIYGIKIPKVFRLLKYSYEYDKDCKNRLICPIKLSIKTEDKEKFVNSLKHYTKFADEEKIPNIQFVVDWWDMNKDKVATAYKKFGTYKYKDGGATTKTSIIFEVFIIKSTDENCIVYLCNWV